MTRGLTSSDFIFLTKICVLAVFVSFHFMHVHHYHTLTLIKKKASIPVVVKSETPPILLAKNARRSQ